MAALYIDENVALGLAPFLRRHGHSVTTTSEERRLGAPDPHQLLYAAQRSWTIITHNRHDFRLQHVAWQLWTNEWRVPLRHAGILVVDQVRAQPLADLAQLIHDFVTKPDIMLAGSLYDLRPATGWTRFS